MSTAEARYPAPRAGRTALALALALCALLPAGTAPAADLPSGLGTLAAVDTRPGHQGGAAGRALLERAEARGRLRLIVGAAQGPGAAAGGREAEAAAAAARDGLLRRLAAGSGAKGPMGSGRGFATIPFVTLEADRATLARLLADPGVASVQEDVPLPPALAESVPKVGADDAWALGFAGRGHAVAVLDSGFDAAHPMLRGKVLAEACYSTTVAGVSASLCPRGAPSSTARGSAKNCASSIAGCSHGTFVAGIAAGRSTALSGVAREGGVVAVQVFSRLDAATSCAPSPAPCVSAYISDIIKGLERVYALRAAHKIAAVNLSLGAGQFPAACDSASPALKAVVDRLRAAGIATVVAAGNDGATGAVSFPACVSSAVAVASTTDADGVSSFSNFGAQVRVAAPGSNITSAVPGGRYASASGTSAAAPHVAGALAVLRQARPTAGVAELVAALGRSPVQVARGGLARPRLDLPAALAGLGARGAAVAWR